MAVSHRSVVHSLNGQMLNEFSINKDVYGHRPKGLPRWSRPSKAAKPLVLQTRMNIMTGLMEKAAAANAEALARKEGRELIGSRFKVEPLKSYVLEALDSKADVLAKVLSQNGVLSLKQALTDETADKVLAFVNEELERAKDDVTSGRVPFDDRFGGVNCRGQGMFGTRHDLFLPVSSPIIYDALCEVTRRLGPLLEHAVTPHGAFHEISSIISNPGSPRQCVHADTIYLPCPQYPVEMPPLYTFFVALQDVEDDMGHTTFLPQSHTEDVHKLWNKDQRHKEKLLTSLPARTSALKKGDVVIFDSRLLHCGGENTSNKRRVLFYFTLSSQARWPIPDGVHGSNSIRREDFLKWKLTDMGLKPAQA